MYAWRELIHNYYHDELMKQKSHTVSGSFDDSISVKKNQRESALSIEQNVNN